ncbi:hypothetical protein OMK64_18195, partial [Cellulomonas fimi]|uniref:hypothetical protein n=1 Tax=Cellulomonas fimi TaxID=1708 RepID=UPI00234DAF84
MAGAAELVAVGDDRAALVGADRGQGHDGPGLGLHEQDRLAVGAGQTTARTGRYKVFPVIGTMLMVVGALLFSRLAVETPFW